MSLQSEAGIHAATFKPHPAIRNAHVQTMWATLFRPLPEVEFRFERWDLPDGDFVDLGWVGELENRRPLAVLVHGLTGGFDSKYLRGTAQQLMQRGWAGVALQLRGAGEEPNRLAPAYHQGHTQDVHALLERLKTTFPDSHLGLVGWSLGGNI